MSDCVAASGPPAVLLRPWVDPVVDALGYPARSLYVEACWLPVLGPTATWLYRRLGPLVEAVDGGVELDLVELAGCLGLGTSLSRHSRLAKALARLCQFEVLRGDGRELQVRRALAPLTQRQLSRLPEAVQRTHEQLTRARDAAG